MRARRRGAPPQLSDAVAKPFCRGTRCEKCDTFRESVTLFVECMPGSRVTGRIRQGVAHLRPGTEPCRPLPTPPRLPAHWAHVGARLLGRPRLALGDRDSALESLEEAWGVAPEMARVHPMSQELMRVLTSLHRRSNPRLTRLAKRAGVPF
ncbi:hypothetical protein GCM10010094_44540 [Streptomyces flaveus]|uniref:Uncharacterized protein n=1 Tax=Streptomyces flaveus TaxID=66370 RepID=A0A917VHN2_9ACTN|nr:hypothetical protein GCM10010094_44540 [Streptomyces flaveus]